MAADARCDERPKVVALFNIEDSGHLNPMLGLSEGLVTQGWQVHFFAPRTVRAKVEGTGATWCHYGSEDWELFEAARRAAAQLQVEPDEELAQRKMPYAVTPASLDVLPHLVGRMVQLRPRFICFDAACVFAWYLGKLLGIPSVSSMTALPLPMKERERWGETFCSSTRVLDAAARALQEAYGLEFNYNHAYTNYTPYTIIWSSRVWHRGHEEFDSAQFRYWGPQTSGRRGGSEALAAGPVHAVFEGLGDRPLVYFSMGTIATGDAFEGFKDSLRDLYRKVFAAAASMPHVSFVCALGLCVPSARAEDGRIVQVFGELTPPANVTAVARVDQLSVLQRASAFITHCGQNSCSEAIVHGVPVVSVPMFGDQVANAQRFEELGCGLMHCYKKDLAVTTWNPDHDFITEECIAASVRRVLEEPSFGEAIRALRARQLEETDLPFAERLGELLAHVDAQPVERLFDRFESRFAGA